MKNHFLILPVIFFLLSLAAQNPDSTWFSNNYYKIERQIPMRDGIKLFTAIYIPKDKTNDTGFQKASIKIYHGGVNNSKIILPVIK